MNQKKKNIRMKRILLIIAGTCLLAHAGEAGISFGAIPGGMTLGSLVSGKTRQARRAAHSTALPQPLDPRKTQIARQNAPKVRPPMRLTSR